MRLPSARETSPRSKRRKKSGNGSWERPIRPHPKTCRRCPQATRLPSSRYLRTGPGSVDGWRGSRHPDGQVATRRHAVGAVPVRRGADACERSCRARRGRGGRVFRTIRIRPSGVHWHLRSGADMNPATPNQVRPVAIAAARFRDDLASRCMRVQRALHQPIALA